MNLSSRIRTSVSIFGIAAGLSLAAGSSKAADGAPHFEHDFDKAAAVAKKENKPLIVIFSASWCPPCQQMKKEVYPSKTVTPYHDSFVWA